MTEALLTREETRELSIWGVLGKRRIAAWRWLAAIALAAVAWLGGLAAVSPFRPNQVWEIVSILGAPGPVYLACLATAGSATAIALLLRQTPLAALAAAVTAYLSAFWLSRFFYVAYRPSVDFPFTDIGDGLGFAVMRLWWLIPAFAALGAAALIFRGEPRPQLGFGDWSVRARDTSAKERPLAYWRKLLIGFTIVSLILAIVFQAPLRFEPITSGKLWALMPAILIAAFVNATAEEVVYRGFMQPAFMRVLGVGGGMWMAGLFFGLVHWGISVGLLAALPVSLLIGLGAVIWGKAAYETKGLAWPIAAHFMIDVAIMSAYFV